MKEITCPNCHTTFQVDESAYAAILEQVRGREFERELERRIAELQSRAQADGEVRMLKATQEFERRMADRERRIAELEASLAGIAQKHENDLLKARSEKADELHRKETEIETLKMQVKSVRLTAENNENRLREHHKLQLEDREAEISRLKDFKLRLSTKMVGETLEQHCAILFERAQSEGLYPDARFDKDTIAAEGTKGDFIFRDYIDGEEYISIMFEMKNENDATATKHRNDDFLDKLHRDREKKECEYAVLVSMLEQDNDNYNAGIVDKSYRYPKMVVIRPQFFMPVLRLLTQAARKGHEKNRELRTQLEVARSERGDFTRFEEKIEDFRTALGNNVEKARKKFAAATDGIDKAIQALEKQIAGLKKIKADFEASDLYLQKADAYTRENLTIKKLTHGNPTIRKLLNDNK